MIYESRFKVIFKDGDFTENLVTNGHSITPSPHLYRKKYPKYFVNYKSGFRETKIYIFSYDKYLLF